MKITFVCTGNASRSAAAEVVLRKMLSDNNIEGIVVDSCGIKVPEGLKREETMRRIAVEHGYDLGGYAVPMSPEILDSADLVIVMMTHHRDEVTRILKYDNWNHIARFNDYCFGESSDLPDPHYQTEHVYRTCFDTIECGCREIITKLKNGVEPIS